jgi:AcrR family transcriptional regulator
MKVAPAKTKPNKRDAILNAMLDVVVERGFHEAPMSLIAERAGASAGVIYHHFASKEEIIQALYERVRGLEAASLLQGYSPDKDAREAFLQGWSNMYHFNRKHPREMRFLEQYESAGFICRPGEKSPELLAFGQRFSGRANGGVLKDWPPEVLETLTIGVVVRLAKQPRTLSPAILREIAEKMWEVVRAEE